MRYLIFLHIAFKLADRYVQTFVGDQISLHDGVLLRMSQGNKFVVLLKIRKGQGRYPANGLVSCIARPLYPIYEAG